MKLERSNRKPEQHVELELRYKRAVILRETGHEGEAILLLEKILFSEDYERCGSDYFYYAIVDLARYYVRIMQPEEVNKVLSKLPNDMREYVEVITGDGYLLVMADKAMLEADFENALHYYKKAYRVNTSPVIKEKIRQLKGNK